MIDRLGLLCGSDIYVQGIGHFRSPKLSDICTSEEKYMSYKVNYQLFNFRSKDVLALAEAIHCAPDFNDLSDIDRNEASAYSLLTHSIYLREMLRRALNFFIVERVVWSKEYSCFLVQQDCGDSVKNIGVIDSESFATVCDAVRGVLHIGTGNTSAEKYASDTAKKWWDMAAAKESEQPVRTKDFDLDNVISKLCAAGIGYTLFNIFDLTIYQLYDQFGSYSHLRISGISENAYAHNGGENFDAFMWYRNNN